MSELARVIDGARRGEQAAYRALYERCRPLVVRLLEAFASLDRDEREDIVQETFTRAFRGLPKLADPAAFQGWLCAIARNRALSALERRQGQARTRAALADEPVQDVAPTPPALLAELEASVVREVIAALPEGPEKETVRLFYVEGQLSAREIGEKLGVGKSAVTMRLERFRARVKRDVLVRILQARGRTP